ncbi:secretin N-terminal domain-containing protein [Novipirellula artificiosorum]|uniref:Bacterial type II/III secretion system short domain protein n=1 Tax=Novipirellula artificiosorum TaxID=2528016 RepID=A0A5C6D672_9BACT|nr:secretin N-terminal domain-containing protein [Novipirellula artificiosorum]TWU31555.1 Bacterial type II/III secretion system short domain protein [Novipirellula artificiosorum]
MTHNRFAHRCLYGMLLAWVSTWIVVVQASAQGVNAEIEATAQFDQTSATDSVRFSFDGVPWREVVNWIAEEADLALHVGDLPPGSFTYSDPESFTCQEAIDRINLFLLSEGYTLVQSGKLLSVINLGDPRSLQQLDVLAELVTVDRLAAAKNHDVVKCFFPLGELEAEDAVAELSALKLMMAPTVLAKTNQLLITDTVAKLKNVQAVLQAFEPDGMDNGTIVQSFALQNVDAEDILVVARPHLGLATGEMIGIDVSLSADLQGKHIFVTGVEDKVKLIENLVRAIDQPAESMTSSNQEMELRSHLIEGGNVETVYNVLQTLLAGKSVRLSMDESTRSVVALASPSVQQEIAQTVTQLQASDAAFEVIPLKTVDPYFAISLLEQMLDLPGPLDDLDEIDEDAPKIDADPGNMRLFVRGKKHQIEQIKSIVEGLEQDGVVRDVSDQIRVLPLRGKQAVETVVTAAKFWRSANPILLLPSTDSESSDQIERVPSGEILSLPSNEGSSVDPSQSDSLESAATNAKVLTSINNHQAFPIRVQVTPRGLILQSDDTVALDRFEEHLRSVAGPVDSLPSPPVVFYLQHAKADDALRMLGELIDGGESAKEGEAGTLVNGYVSGASSGALSSFIMSQDGTTTMMAGSMTVVADSRLNRLIAQGNAVEMDLIEGYLRIIDKDRSITSIETYGTSHVIELVNTNASEVAVAIREAFAGRVTGATGAGGQPNQRGAAQPAQRESGGNRDNENQEGDPRKAGAKRPASQPVKDLEPKITVAVHEPSNSLIVTAPDSLFAEVEKLAMVIDARGEQSVEVVTPISSEVFGAVLQQVLLGEERSRNDRSTSRSSGNSYQRSRTDR